MGAVTLLVYFLVAFVIGYAWAWFAIINDDTTDFQVFSSDEEVERFHQACFDGMRKGIE